MGYLALYLAITVAGFLIGSQLKKRNISLPWVGTMQTVVIVCLIFLMGSRIGANDEIVSSLDTIGLISFAYTMVIAIVTCAAYSIARRLMGFDRYGIRRSSADRQRLQKPQEPLPQAADAPQQETSEQRPTKDAAGSVDAEEEEPAPSKLNSLTILIVVFMAVGILAGYLILPEGFIAVTGTLLTIALCILLVLIGVDIGTSGTLAKNFRSAGWRILVFPFVNIAAMIIGSLIASWILPLSAQDALCVGSGFAWYSLAPVMLAEYSTRVSAISFMHNVFREIVGILVIPFVARRIGYIESYGICGSTSMDVCLPLIERSTSSDVAVYSFINEAIVSASVPILVTFFMNL